MILLYLLIILVCLFRYKENYTNSKKSKKYLIYKATGGLFHMLQFLQGCLNFAKLEDRILIIDTQNLNSFRLQFDEIFYIKGIKYYTSYKKIPKSIKNASGIKISDLSKKSVIWGKYKSYYFNNVNISKLKDDEKSIVRTQCAVKNTPNNNKQSVNIFVNKEIMKKIRKHMINSKYIGVHYRNTDIKTNIKVIINQIRSNLKENPDIYTIFIATDNYKSISRFKKSFPNTNIISFCKIKDNNLKNIHYLDDKILKDNNLTKKQQIIDVLIDAYLLYKSNIFIGSMKSSVSKYIDKIRNNNIKNIFNE
tara:strand:- start:518 stop:1438 length:921 start_codon:yes stop_codon:yes gene_type:complete